MKARFRAGAAFACALLAAIAFAPAGCGRKDAPPGSVRVTFEELAAFTVPDPGEGGSLPGAVSEGVARTAAGPRGSSDPSSNRSSDSSGIAPAGPADPTSALVPEAVRALNGRAVSIQGYMVPVEYDDEGTTRFVLLRCTLACCFGKLPRVNEWIDVTVIGGKKVPCVQDRPVEVSGRLIVKEDLQEGSLVGLYSLEAEKVAKARAS